MSKNIRFDLYVENKLRQEFFSTYMPINKPDTEIIEMFLEDEDYSVITQDKSEMKRKLQDWARLYKEINQRKKIPNYIELKADMKKLIKSYGGSVEDVKGVFVSEQLYKGMTEEDAYKIANMIIKDIKGGDIIL